MSLTFASPSSAAFDAVLEVATSLRLELAFLGSFAAIWFLSRVFGFRFDQLLAPQRPAKKTAPTMPKAVHEGPVVPRRRPSVQRAAVAAAEPVPGVSSTAAITATSPIELQNPSNARLSDARWVFAAVQQMSRAQDQQQALELYRKARRSGMSLKALPKTEGSHLFMLLVTAAIRVGRMSEALSLLRDCRDEGPGISQALLTSVTKLATANQNFKDCLVIYEYIAQDKALVVDDRCVWSCLIFCGVESRAYHLVVAFWEGLKKCGEATYKDYGNMMRYASAQVDWQLALALLGDMRKQGLEVERVIYNTALAICVSANQLNEAVVLLEEMEKVVDLADVITYNTLAKGYAKGGQLDACFELCGRLRSRGLSPSQVTYGILLDCCINQNHIDKARQVFDHMLSEGCTMNTVLYTTMIKGFARADKLDEAMKIYHQMSSDTSGNVAPDVITFSILIKANCDAGRLTVALNLLEAMMELKLAPDEVIFNNLIGGCLQESNTTLAKRLYNNMIEGGIKPSTATFSILIRLYSSCKMMDQAVELLTSEPAARGVEAAPRLFLQLMQCCLRDRQGRRAVEVYKLMSQPATALMHGQLLGTCAKLNMLETGAEILTIAAEKGGSVAFTDAEQLRDIAVRKKRVTCAEMIEEAMGRLHLVR